MTRAGGRDEPASAFATVAAMADLLRLASRR
jgi:hypothetical protein